MRLVLATPPARKTNPLRARRARRARRPAHEVSTAHLQAAYPFLAEGGLGAVGIYIGRDAYGQAVCWDPFELYEARVISSPNIFMAGQIGTGKSSLPKTFLYRSSVIRDRYSWIVDVKGEYGPLREALGGSLLRLRPGGDVRLNPISRLAGAEQQDALLQAVAAAALGRHLRPEEATGVTAALDVVRSKSDEPTLPEVVKVLLVPTADMATRLVTSEEKLAVDVRSAALGLMRLCEGELRGMFDGPTSASIDWNAKNIVIDLSEVANSRALAVLMACASAEMQAQVANRHRQAVLEQRPTPKTHAIIDECWRVYKEVMLGELLQAKQKLARQFGEAVWTIMHRLSDLTAAGDAGSKEVQLAEGLLSDTDIRISYKQASDQIRNHRERLALTSTQAGLLPTFMPGVALHQIGTHSAVVQHRLSSIERRIIETDQNMHLKAA